MILLLLRSGGHTRGIGVLVLADGAIDEGKVGVDSLGEADGPAVEIIVLEPIISPDEEVSVDCSVIGDVDVDCVDVAGLPVAVAQLH
jgi:hypothetical protein